MVKSILIVVIALNPTLSKPSFKCEPMISNVDSMSVVEHLRRSLNRIVAIGAFTNMKYDEEHAYGYTAQLWREQDRIFGFFLSSQGLMGDTPTGLLEDVRFDSSSGKISFRARLTTGLFSNRQFHNVPSRDIFRFTGFLKKGRLVGTLEITNGLTPEEAPRSERIRLNRSKSESESMIEAQSYDDWKNQADEILKFRGPKW
jgi:hypothetical protein